MPIPGLHIESARLLNAKMKPRRSIPSRRQSLPCFGVLLTCLGIQAFTAPHQHKTFSPSSAVLLAADNLFFASTVTREDTDSATSTVSGNEDNISPTQSKKRASHRTLGSQELLMLPRQYRPKLDQGEPYFPSMSHVQVTTLSATPSVEALSQAIDIALDTHPLLRCHVEGDGEPTERIDLFQMVRKGEPNPCTFVAPETNTFTSKDVLRVVDVPGSDEDALQQSWRSNFEEDIDDGSWYERSNQGPLWKLTLHRMANVGDGNDAPCAIVFSSNHAISDQGKLICTQM